MVALHRHRKLNWRVAALLGSMQTTYGPLTSLETFVRVSLFENYATQKFLLKPTQALWFQLIRYAKHLHAPEDHVHVCLHIGHEKQGSIRRDEATKGHGRIEYDDQS